MLDYQKEFIAYALECGVLKFGEFQLKSGRISPYFFNTGLFNTGAMIGKLGEFYAQTLIHSGLKPDVIYGPAYKGIPLACAAAIAYANMTGNDMPYAFNRKEAKDHGEGGAIVGNKLAGKVLIIDDVITAGTSVRESVEIIKEAGAEPMAVLIALDRQEKAHNQLSAVQEVEENFKIPVLSIININSIISHIRDGKTDLHAPLEEIMAYQDKYGA
ncbi:MAG: orotate phosphoribosyltransferase [Gammaproteobacteria bacterium]|nr:orotate phosphoribosyltransferase [Gammaproteobacteria bacterium]